MFGLIEKRTDKVILHHEKTARYAKRQDGKFYVSGWFYWLLVVGTILSLAIIIHPAFLIGFTLVIVAAIFCADKNEWPKTPALLIGRDYKFYPIFGNVSDKWWDDDIKQMALRDMCDEWDKYGDNFDIYDWKADLKSLDQQLEEKFNIEKEAERKFANRPKYAELVRETNEIMKKGLADL